MPMENSCLRHRPLWAALAASAAVRAWLFAGYAGSPLSGLLRLDESQYAQTALEIAAGAILPDYLRTNAPGYPLFLAPFFLAMSDPLALIRLAQTALGLASAAIGYFLALRLFSSRAAAGVSALLLGLYWPFLIFEQHLLSATLFVFLNLLGLLLAAPAEPDLEKTGAPRLVAAGLVFGLAVLVVPTAALPVILITAGLLFSPGLVHWLRSARAATFLACALLPVLPFVIAERSRTGEWFFLQTNSGLNLYLGNSPGADGTPWARPGGSWDMLTALPVRAGAESDAAQDRWFTRQALAFAADRPGAFAALWARKAGLALNRREVYATIWPEFHRTLFAAARLPLPGFGVILALAAAGLAAQPRGSARRTLLLYLGGYLLALTATVVSSRYRLPLAAGLCVLGGAGAVEVGRAGRELWGWTRGVRPTPRAATILLLAAAGGLISRVPLALPHADRMLAEERSNLAEAYLKKGDLKEGAAYARAALEADPKSALACLQLARAAAMSGRSDEALEWLRRAADADPQSSEARYQYAFGLAAAGDLPGALVEMRAAVAAAPQRVTVLMGLAELAARAGNREEARSSLMRVYRLRPGFAPARELEQMFDAGPAGPGGSP